MRLATANAPSKASQDALCTACCVDRIPAYQIHSRNLEVNGAHNAYTRRHHSADISARHWRDAGGGTWGLGTTGSEDMSAEPKAEIEGVIDKKLWDPAEFVQWWNENVRDKRHLTVAEAEE